MKLYNIIFGKKVEVKVAPRKTLNLLSKKLYDILVDDTNFEHGKLKLTEKENFRGKSWAISLNGVSLGNFHGYGYDSHHFYLNDVGNRIPDNLYIIMTEFIDAREAENNQRTNELVIKALA